MNMQNLNRFHEVLALGYDRPIPIIPPDAPISERSSLSKRVGTSQDGRGKSPGVRWPDGTWAGFDWIKYEMRANDPERWHAMGAGVGIRTGQGLVMIDADTTAKDRAKIIHAEIEKLTGPMSIRFGQFPKAGYPVRTDPDFEYCRIEFGDRNEKGELQDRVEILAEKKQFVAIGTHRKTGKPYEWTKGIPERSALPFVSGADLRALLTRLSGLLPSASPIIVEGSGTDNDVDQATLLGDPALIAAAVRATPNTSDLFGVRERYLAYGYAIKAAYGPDREGEAFEVFSEWCDRWVGGANEPDVVASDWARMKPPFRRGASWLYELAEKHGDGSFSSASQWFEPIVETAPLFPEDNPPSSQNLTKRFVFESFADASSADDDNAAPLIKGLLDKGAMTVLYGPSNVGKTFVAMDIAFHVAAGLSYAGLKTAHGCVVYVAAEGGRGARKRLRALRDRYVRDGGSSAVQFLLLRSGVDLRRPDADLKPLISAIRDLGVPVLLIVIDTLSRAMAGGDENSSVDMGFIVNHFDALRQHTAAHLMVVHHSGKDAARGARGHSLLRAATDTEIEVSEGLISVEKQRDLDKSWKSAFSLRVAVLGVDSDGDPISSCTIDLTAPAVEVAAGIPTTAEAHVLEAIGATVALLDEPDKGVGLREIVDFMAETADKMSYENVRSNVRRMLTKHLIKRVGRSKFDISGLTASPVLQGEAVR